MAKKVLADLSPEALLRQTLEKQYGKRPDAPPITVSFYSRPMGKVRAHPNFKTKTVYKDKADRTYESIVAEAGRNAVVMAMVEHTGLPQLKLPYFENTKWPLGIKLDCYGWKSKIPFDVDNLQKGAMDALQGIIYKNDRQICSIGKMDRYKVATAAEQRVIFTIYALDYVDAQNR